MANKLELTWYGKDKEISVEPRLLIERPELSNTDADPDTENMLIHGDNLLALKALESKYAGQVKCIYIDPPYNTGSAFEHYDDNLEHSQWLSLMYSRLIILKQLLRNDGSIWISIDDTEMAYLRVLCDEIFGRNNFVTTIIWEKRKTRENRRAFSFKHDYILVYAVNKVAFEETRNPVELTDEVLKRYKNPDNDPRGVWQSVSVNAQAGHATASQFYEITTPSGKTLNPPAGRCWRFTKQRFEELIADNRIYFGEDGNNVPRQKKFLSESENAGLTPETIWYADDVGTNDTSKKEILSIFGENIFDTPKPESLIERVLRIASNEGDLVLDSFLGSGTTAAVAHKMGRRYIGIEMGEHAYTHCKKRLDMVVSGEDKGGISRAVKWENGGGYRFYELAPTLINKDEFGEYIINPDYSADMLAAAMALHEGFTYEPDSSVFWKQSHGNEKSYLFVTTRHLNAAFMDSIIGGMEDDEYLVIACCSFDKGMDKLNPHITVKKIPQMLLERCEFDKADYNLNIIHPPVYDDEEECDDEG
jgi:adenine-specific DNA-methyltransferase